MDSLKKVGGWVSRNVMEGTCAVLLMAGIYSFRDDRLGDPQEKAAARFAAGVDRHRDQISTDRDGSINWTTKLHQQKLSRPGTLVEINSWTHEVVGRLVVH